MKDLYAAKDWFTKILSPVVNFAVKSKLSPDLFTFMGMLGAAIAAWGIVILDPLTTLAGLILRLAGANLDGAVARARNLHNPLGFFINELGDRVSDLTVMFAFVLVAMQNMDDAAVLSTVFAALFANIPTLVSLLGYRMQKQIGIAKPVRLNGGPVGKTERCAMAFFAVLAIADTVPVSFALVVFGVLISIGSVVTAIVRVRKLSKMLGGAK